MLKKSSSLCAVIVLLTLALCIPAAADTLANETTNLSGALGQFSLASLVTYDGSLYTYQYTLTYIAGTGTHTAHTFAIENVEDVPYSSAWNNSGFANPVYDVNAWAYELKWINGNLLPGNSAMFSYQSQFGPQLDIPRAFTYVVNSGDSATGSAIGMGGVVPEPSSLAALAMGLCGLIPVVRRRRR